MNRRDGQGNYLAQDSIVRWGGGQWERLQILCQLGTRMMGGVQRWSRRNWNQHPIPRFRGIEVRHCKQGNDPWSEVLDYMGCHQENSWWKRVEIGNRGGQ